MQFIIFELMNILLSYQKANSSKWTNMDDNLKFEQFLDKMVKENKLDKNLILSKLKQSLDSNSSAQNASNNINKRS
jgi:hypothetical protein